MSDYVKKSVLLSGKLNSSIVYIPCPAEEISHFSFVAVNSVIFSAEEDINQVCILSCNMVQDKVYSKNYEIMTVQNPMSSFSINIKRGNSSSLTFETIWFPINSLFDQLRFNIQTKERKNINKTCDITIIIFFK